MENIMIDIREYTWLEKIFKNKDYITLEELLDKVDNLYYENENLKEEIEDMKNTTEEDEYNSYLDDLRNRKRDENE